MNPIDELLRVLETTDRFGAEHDEPEGSRCIILTDTLARNLVAAVREWRAREWSDAELTAEYWRLADSHLENWVSPSGLRAVERAVRERMTR